MKNLLLGVFVSFIIMMPQCMAQNSKEDVDYYTIGAEIMQYNLDHLNINVLPSLGEPDSKSKAEVWEGDALTHQEWSYLSRGIMLDMVDYKGGQVINAITIIAPSELKTLKHIGIGSSNTALYDVYKDQLNPEESELNKLKNNDPSEYTVTAGTCYGGVIFTMKNNKVIKIFIGAAAE